MDEIVKKIAGLGLPGVLLVILTAAGGASATVVTTITALGGPFGLMGGLGILGLITFVGDALAGYGIENLLKEIYAERKRKKEESVRTLLKEIEDLPITSELKLTLKNSIGTEVNSDVVSEPTPPKKFDIT